LITSFFDRIADRSAASALVEAALDASNVALWQTDLRTGKVSLSRAWSRIVGEPVEEVETTLDALMARVHPEDLPEAKRRSLEVMRGVHQTYDVEHRVLTRDGAWKWILSRGMVIERDPASRRALVMAGTNVDIDERRRQEEALRASEHRLRVITENIPALIGYVDSEGVYRFNNRMYEVWYGLDREQIRGRKLAELLEPAARPLVAPCIARALRGELVRFEHALERGGATRYVETTFVPDTDEAGNTRGFYVLGTDVSLLKETERRLLLAANYDPLTGAANRRLLEDRLSHAIALGRRRGWTLAVLYLDVDRFKAINDERGHVVGDHVLREMAARLRGCVREEDTVARVGGDEFVLVLEDVKDAETAARIAAKVLDAARRPVHYGEDWFVVTASVGIALLAENETAEALIARADAALYDAKQYGRNRYRLAA
jgi:diguanylate cyclase (GGDEF)-like protein/PAS domain S-box-containing protein